MPGKRGQKGLTPKQEAFCRAYIENGGNASAAYRVAYDASGSTDKSVHESACKVLANAKVASRISELQAKIAQKHGVTVDRIVGELATLGFSNMQDFMTIDESGVPRLNFKGMSRDKASAISEMTVEEFTAKGEDGESSSAGVRKVKFKLYDKRAALVDLGKHLGMFKDIVEHTGKNGAPIQVEAINDVESARRIAYALGKAIGKAQAAKQDTDASSPA